MVTALFKEGQKAATTTSLQKYDYGEVLRIKGLSLPRYVAVQFAVDGMSEALPSSIGETVEDVTDVLIPNSLLRSNIKPWNYNIMAYVYIVSGNSGKTEYTITIPVKWRPKTGDDQAADDDVAAVIGTAVEKMNTATQKAEAAANQAAETAAEISVDREQIQTNATDISSLKGDLDNQRKGINDGYEYDLLLTYSVGGFSSTTGVNTDNPIRIRTDYFYKPDSEKICNVLVKDGCQLYIQEFKYKAGTDSYEPTENSAFGYWITEDTTITLTPDYYYKMMIRKNVDEQVENPLSMAESIIFGKVSELNYIPSIINDHMCAEVNNLEFPVEWEIGGLNGGTGNNVDNATRIRTKEWINFGDLTEVTIKWNVGQIYIMSKENNSTHIVSSWLSPQEYKLTIDKGYVYRFMYQYTGNADISWSNRVHFLFDKKIPLDEYSKIDNRQTKTMKVVTMGDSMFLYGNKKDTNSWQYVMNDYFNFKELISVGIGGSGFIWNATRNYDMPSGHAVGDNLTFESGVSETALHNSAFCSWYRIVNTIPKDANLVIVGTGTNDYGSSDMNDDLSDMNFITGSQVDAEWVNSEYYSVFGGDYDITKRRGAMLSTIMKIQLQAPNAKIVFLNFPNTRLSNGTGQNTTSIQNIAYDRGVLDAMEYIHKYWGIPLIDLYGTCGINPLNRAKYTADGIHCNPLGYSTMFANAVIAGLKPLLNNGIDY